MSHGLDRDLALLLARAVVALLLVRSTDGHRRRVVRAPTQPRGTETGRREPGRRTGVRICAYASSNLPTAADGPSSSATTSPSGGHRRARSRSSDDTFASSVHARSSSHDGELWLEDLGSTNGTFVNDERLDGPVPAPARRSGKGRHDGVRGCAGERQLMARFVRRRPGDARRPGAIDQPGFCAHR